ncbi:flagellar hook-associated protein FlgL [Chitiniphilus shinanonensis]|uniref:Flagellar hook-associated protein FlgL n=1 Tax=Chitiniphilus shinanonensis TaxID=553088 RepID=A0ABQ6BVX1_9NEIS|nr:flagellar hook-associated protein FlgL [Chitiniphilus shinanonensis]GLS04342.1 flagellar hook-associated protein FlgL [Chitiniphilus shinanonensis]
MRVATNTVYSQGSMGISRLMAQQSKLQNQLATGRRVLSPSDDPIASSRALQISQAQSINTQYSTNSDSADTSLAMTEKTLNQLVTLIQNVQSLAVSAGNPTQTADQKKMLDAELQGRYQELLALANATDGNGEYLFSGFRGDTKPFTEAGFGNVTYNGDDGQRGIQISASRTIPVSEAGSKLFQRVPTGNGTFTSSANMANTGTGIITTGEVLDPSKWANAANVQDFRIEFNSIPDPNDPTAAPIVNYDIIDSRATLPDGSANPNYNMSMVDGYDYNGGARPSTPGVNSYPRTYKSGADIEFKQLPGETTPLVANWDFGVKTSVTGDPKTGDTFTVAASKNTDIFSVLADFSSALNNYNTAGNGKGQTDFQNQLNTVIKNLSNSLDTVLSTQASIGARMLETESVRNTNEDVNLQYTATLSKLQDLDWPKAISDFSQNQMLLDAARSSFSQVQNLSLFQYI